MKANKATLPRKLQKKRRKILIKLKKKINILTKQEGITRRDVIKSVMKFKKILVKVRVNKRTTLIKCTVEVLTEVIEKGMYNLPPFQRNQNDDKAWNLQEQQDFISTILKDGNVPQSIIMARNDNNYSEKPEYNIHSNEPNHILISIDGYNRTISMADYRKGKFSCNGRTFNDLPPEDKEKFLNAECSVTLYTECLTTGEAIEIFNKVNKGKRIDQSTKTKNNLDKQLNVLLYDNGLMVYVETIIKRLFKSSNVSVDKYWIHYFSRCCLICLYYNSSDKKTDLINILSYDDSYIFDECNDVIKREEKDISFIEEVIERLRQYTKVFDYISCRDYSLIGVLFSEFLKFDDEHKKNTEMSQDDIAQKFAYLINKGASPYEKSSRWYGRTYPLNVIGQNNKPLINKEGINVKEKVKYGQTKIKEDQADYTDLVVSALTAGCSLDDFVKFPKKTDQDANKKEQRIPLTTMQKRAFKKKHGFADDNTKMVGRCIDCNEYNKEIVIGHIFPYAVSGCNKRENLVPICIHCNQHASTDNNSNQISHQNKHNKLADVKITKYMRDKFPNTFKNFYDKWRGEYNLPEL